MAPPPSNEDKIAEAKKLSKESPKKAESLYKEVLSTPPTANEASLRDFETALGGLGELYRDQKRPEDLADLVKQSRGALSSYAKAKTAKLGMRKLKEGVQGLS
jgi:hypothetical protein